MLETYLARIHTYSEAEVKNVLRHLLVQTRTHNIDFLYLESRIAAIDGRLTRNELDAWQADFQETSEYHRRLWRGGVEGDGAAYEGITWVLDLLPDEPSAALQVVFAYTRAHASTLTWLRIDGLSDAYQIIFTRYISGEHSLEARRRILLELKPRELEQVVEHIFFAMGYSTDLTPKHSDGGRDIVASRDERGLQECVYVECKRWERPVGVDTVRALLGVVEHEKANRAALVTTSWFTHPAHHLAATNRIELISGHDLVFLLNQHLGWRWPRWLPQYAHNRPPIPQPHLRRPEPTFLALDARMKAGGSATAS